MHVTSGHSEATYRYAHHMGSGMRLQKAIAIAREQIRPKFGR